MENQNVKNLKNQLENGYKILENYSWLLDAYVMNYFVENHLDQLSRTWKNCVNEMTLEKFEYLLNYSTNKPNNVWPLSIICLKVLIQSLSLSRKLSEKEKLEILKSNQKGLFDVFENETFLFKDPKIRCLFVKHVKPKKRYEILKIGNITSKSAKKLEVECVVDVGSGLGHLSRLLAFGFGLKVCSIETQPELIIQAEKLDQEWEKKAKKYLNEATFKNIQRKMPARLIERITTDLLPNEFAEKIKKCLGFVENNFKFGIVGLHPCGDLTPVLLKLFVHCPEAKFICLVGCCYHKLSTSSCIMKSGFPLSKFCLSKKINLSYEAKSLACHAVEAHCEKLKSNYFHPLKIHCYRAVLELLIQKNWPQFQKTSLGNVKSFSGLTFEKYCSSALSKLNVNVPEEDFMNPNIMEKLHLWMNVAKFYTLRLMFAPLIETLILLDRQMYLLEKGIENKLTVVFDPQISPRNQLLLGEKNI